MIDLNSKIIGAESFRYSEFLKSTTAIRQGILNIPDEKSLDNIKSLAVNVLQPVREQFGRIKITSGFRCKELNKLISSPTSLHILGAAADIEPVDHRIKLLDILKWINSNCDYKELISEFLPDGWIHVGYLSGSNDRKIKLKNRQNNYKIVDIRYLEELYEQ